MVDLLFGNFGVEIIKLIQNIGGESLDGVFQLITFLGNTISYVIIILIIYWIYDKKAAVKLLWVTIITSFTVGIIKGFVGLKRPFQVLDSTENLRLNWEASGYSFPSGHASSSTSFYSMFSSLLKRNWATILCITTFILIGISRIRLAVHWPSDVLSGFIIGGVVFIGFYYYHEPIYRVFTRYDKKIQIYILILLGAFSLIFSILMTAIMGNDLVTGSVGDLIGIFMGSSIGLIMERELDFQPPKTRIKAILRIITGISSTIFVYYGGNLVIDEIHMLLNQKIVFPFLEVMLYTTMSFLFIYLVPKLFVKLDW